MPRVEAGFHSCGDHVVCRPYRRSRTCTVVSLPVEAAFVQCPIKQNIFRSLAGLKHVGRGWRVEMCIRCYCRHLTFCAMRVELG